MTPSEAMTVAGAAVVVTIIVEALKRALAWTEAESQRWGAIISIVIGLAVVTTLDIATGTLTTAGVAGAALTGILAGASACGLYDVAARPVFRAMLGQPRGSG